MSGMRSWRWWSVGSTCNANEHTWGGRCNGPNDPDTREDTKIVKKKPYEKKTAGSFSFGWCGAKPRRIRRNDSIDVFLQRKEDSYFIKLSGQRPFPSTSREFPTCTHCTAPPFWRRIHFWCVTWEDSTVLRLGIKSTRCVAATTVKWTSTLTAHRWQAKLHIGNRARKKSSSPLCKQIAPWSGRPPGPNHPTTTKRLAFASTLRVGSHTKRAVIKWKLNLAF